MALSREQMMANIDAMEKQGKSQQEIQSWLDSLKTQGPEPASPPGIGGKVFGGLQTLGAGMGEVGKGIVKGLATTPLGAETAIDRYLVDPALKAIGKQPVPSSPFPGMLQAKGPLQQAGKFAEQTAELAVPIPGLQAVKGAKILPTMVKGAAEFGAKAALQSGGDPTQTAAGAIGGAAAPIAEKILATGGKALMEFLGRSTGAGEASLREAFNNPEVIKYARKAGAGGAEKLQMDALSEAEAGLRSIVENRSKEYTAALEKIKSSPEAVQNVVSAARDKAKQLLADNSITLTEGKKLNTLDFGESVIEKGQKSVEKAINDVTKWTDETPAGLDKLKKKLASHLNEVKDAPGAYQIIRDLRDTVRTGLEDNVPGYKEMTAGYHQASNLIDEIQHDVLGKKASDETKIKKIMSAVRNDNELRRDLLRTISGGGRDVLGKAAGAQLTPITARGLAGTVETAGATGAALLGGHGGLNVKSIPALLTYLAISSPRLVGEAMTVLGRAERAGLTAATKKALGNIIQKAIQLEAPTAVQNAPQVLPQNIGGQGQ